MRVGNFFGGLILLQIRPFKVSALLIIVQFLLLGAVPFPKDVPRLKQLGVGGVITLNEPYETLVPTSLYYVSSL